ncbi:transcription repressor NadR [Actinomyces sp. MRS3W]|uniref:transcription repressor NadR n=1 Tax=Actinomyces sp. MRS3W TaxID=2800796 RepID=UPI0028FD5087|nr:transcription repressor NadR [Actinomyces sp. MRS3W]MDU0348076.1 transcription repressor NadR [Actinomyces sp. MRS3W]
MDATARRQEILTRLEASTTPLAAAWLGEQLGVSRQIVVGDVALLRAAGHAIRATNRGYLLARPSSRPRRVFHVQHGREQIATELSAIIDAGGTALDTIIEHRLYGQITVDLLIHDHADLDLFLERMTESSTLSELTNGWHAHTIEADTEEQLDAIASRLAELDILR